MQKYGEMADTYWLMDDKRRKKGVRVLLKVRSLVIPSTSLLPPTTHQHGLLMSRAAFAQTFNIHKSAVSAHVVCLLTLYIFRQSRKSVNNRAQ